MRIISISYFLTVVLSIVHVGSVHSENEYSLVRVKVDVSFVQPERGLLHMIGECIGFVEPPNALDLNFNIRTSKKPQLAGYGCASNEALTSRTYTHATWARCYSSSHPTSSKGTEATNINGTKVFHSWMSYQILLALSGYRRAFPKSRENIEMDLIKLALEEPRLFTPNEDLGSENDVSRMMTFFSPKPGEVPLVLSSDLVRNHNIQWVFPYIFSKLMPSIDFVLCKFTMRDSLHSRIYSFRNGTRRIVPLELVWKYTAKVVILEFIAPKDNSDEVTLAGFFDESFNEYWRSYSDDFKTLVFVSNPKTATEKMKTEVEEFLRRIESFWHTPRRGNDDIKVPENEPPGSTHQDDEGTITTSNVDSCVDFRSCARISSLPPSKYEIVDSPSEEDDIDDTRPVEKTLRPEEELEEALSRANARIARLPSRKDKMGDLPSEEDDIYVTRRVKHTGDSLRT